MSQSSRYIQLITKSSWMLSGLILVACLLSLPLNDDAGYFLPHASMMMEGSLPYRDFFTWHSPWGPLLFAPLAWMSPETLLVSFSWFMLIWNGISSALIYRISRQQQGPRWLSITFVAWFLGMGILTSGYYVTLEPLYLPFLLGAYLVMKSQHPRKWMIAGFLIGIAFCIKQFAAIGGIIFLLIAIRREGWKPYLAGAILPIILSMTVLMLAGVDLELIGSHWFSPESPKAYFSSPGNVILILLIFLPILSLGIGSMSGQIRDLWAKLGMIGGFLGLWFLSGNDHYLLPAIAFVAIVHGAQVRPVFVLCSLLLVAGGAGLSVLGQVTGETHDTQLARATATSQLMSDEESLLVMGRRGQYVYALIPNRPPALAEAGYQVFPLMTDTQQEAAVNHADVIMALDCNRTSDPDTSTFKLILLQNRECERWFRRSSLMR